MKIGSPLGVRFDLRPFDTLRQAQGPSSRHRTLNELRGRRGLSCLFSSPILPLSLRERIRERVPAVPRRQPESSTGHAPHRFLTRWERVSTLPEAEGVLRSALGRAAAANSCQPNIGMQTCATVVGMIHRRGGGRDDEHTFGWTSRSKIPAPNVSGE